MSHNMRMPGAWESDSEEPFTTTFDSVGSHCHEPPPPPPSRRDTPSPTTRQGRYIPLPTTGQGRHIPSATTQNRRVPLPTSSKPASEYGLFADSSDGENGAVDKKKAIVIAVFGKTGTGKTSLIKSVTGKDLEVGHSLTSCKCIYSIIHYIK